MWREREKGNGVGVSNRSRVDARLKKGEQMKPMGRSTLSTFECRCFDIYTLVNLFLKLKEKKRLITKSRKDEKHS